MKTEYMETTGQDWANHISHELDSNGMIYLIALLSGLPDAQIMRQAVADSMELQPVLGCRFDQEKDPPVWTPIRENGYWFSVMEAGTWQEGFAALLREKPAQGQLAVRLIQCPEQTALCLRLDHASADGAGAKAYLMLLSRLYNARAAGEKPQENTPQDRSEGQVFEACGVRDFRMMIKRENPVTIPFATFPYRSTDRREVRFAWVMLPLQEIRAVAGCTINDLLLAACARALTYEAETEQQIVLNMTVDLRRYLRGNDTPIACNLSGMEKVCFTVTPGEDFAESAVKASRETASVKADRPGLSSAASMAYLRMMPFDKAMSFLLDASRKARAAGMAAPIISNLGWLNKDGMRFGNVRVSSILPLTPAMHAPAFMLGAGSYGSDMVLSAGYFEGEREAEDVERFLNKVSEELLGKTH